jgi:hypothetical protein
VDPVDPSLDVEQVADPSDAGGRFEVRGLAAGSFRLAVARPRMTLAGEVLLGGKSVEAGRTDVRLVLSPGAVVAGFVTDEEGRAVPGALVYGSTGEGADGGGDESLPDGSFEIGGLAPGRSCLLSARAPGRAAARLRDVPAGTRDARIVLLRTKPISGTLLDAAGRPAAGVRLTFVPRGDFEELHAETDADGRFRLDAAPATYDVVRWPRLLGVAEGGARDVILRMR